MNPRILELKKLATTTRYTGCGEIDELNLEKFAELIIRECADLFEGVYTDQQRPERIDTRIKQHFGVLE